MFILSVEEFNKEVKVGQLVRIYFAHTLREGRYYNWTRKKYFFKGSQENSYIFEPLEGGEAVSFNSEMFEKSNIHFEICNT